MSTSKKDPGSWLPNIQDPGFWRILDLRFSLSRGILDILDHVSGTLSWYPRDLGSKTEKILLDPRDPGLGKIVMGSCGSWMLNNSYVSGSRRYFTSNEILLLVPISMHYLSLSTVQNFNHIGID